MMRPRKTSDATDTQAKLDKLQAAIRREADAAEADPFDEAMVTAVIGIADAIKAETVALAEIEKRLGRVARGEVRRRSCPAHLHPLIGRPS